jgi:transcriptional regulator with XRE-family HTH domain
MTDSPVSHTLVRLGFAKALSKRRAKLGLSQTQLALALDMKRAYVGALESASINVSVDTVQKIRDILWPELEPLNLRMEIGQKILEARGGRVTQEALSGLTHLSVPFISSLERGLSNTSLDQFGTLSSVLEFDALGWMAERWFGLTRSELTEWNDSVTVKEVSLRDVVATDLRRLRNSFDITQGELAGRMGITKGRVSQIERAKTNLALDTVEQFVFALIGPQLKIAPTFAAQVSERVVRLRKKLGFSQEMLAERANLSRATISRIERADVSTSIDQLEAVGSALDLKGRELVDGLYPVVSEKLHTRAWLLQAIEALSKRQS